MKKLLLQIGATRLQDYAITR